MSKTAAEMRQELRARGETVRGWARDHDFPEQAVRAVLAERNKGNWGQSHRIAVALGLKEQPE